MKKINWVLASLVACLALRTAASEVPTKPALSAIGAFFAVSVADIETSGAWYSKNLGLVVSYHPPKSGPGQVMVLEGGGLMVELIQHDEAIPLAKLAPAVSDSFKVHGIFKAGVVVKDLDATLAYLKERGVPIAFGPFAAKEGRRANFIIRDNAGNLIQFFGS
jgi:catechol 2,3-dioxygenase-like lactoylglutathione lyase family enzyme